MIHTLRKPNFGYDIEPFTTTVDMKNKLFCTFSTEQELEETINSIKSTYHILYNKIFILYSEEQGEYLTTYNVDLGNIHGFLKNTILVHRKKQTNTLYTINALNSLILSLNSGVPDNKYQIDWDNYKNSVILTKDQEVNILKTKLFRIVETL
jgi:hypothetical protein